MTLNINPASSFNQLTTSNQLRASHIRSSFDNFKSKHSGPFSDIGIKVNISANFNSSVTSSIASNTSARVPNNFKANPYVHALDSLRVRSLI